jgi:hypothetical protein
MSAAAAAVPSVYDNFTICPGSAGSAFAPTDFQWGGKINGGIVQKNVACVHDADLGKQVVQLTAHGDNFTGTGPVGINKDLSARTSDEEWVDWKWDGYQPTCSPYCHVRRVGGGIKSVHQFVEGSFEVRLKPCKYYGAATAFFLYNYTEEKCGSLDKPNVENKCSPAYTKQCCIDGNCTINMAGKTGDVCRGTWVKNLEIDVELPTSLSIGQGSVNPALINYANARFNTIVAFPWSYKNHTKCGVKQPCESDNYTPLNPSMMQNDGKYHTYRFDVVSGTSVNFYVDGTLQATVTGSEFVPDFSGVNGGSIYIASWFPNAWTGTPDFDTCETLVDYFRFTPTSSATTSEM